MGTLDWQRNKPWATGRGTAFLVSEMPQLGRSGDGTSCGPSLHVVPPPRDMSPQGQYATCRLQTTQLLQEESPATFQFAINMFFFLFLLDSSNISRTNRAVETFALGILRLNLNMFISASLFK